jgi:hypothetical protein
MAGVLAGAPLTPSVTSTTEDNREESRELGQDSVTRHAGGFGLTRYQPDCVGPNIDVATAYHRSNVCDPEVRVTV